MLKAPQNFFDVQFFKFSEKKCQKQIYWVLTNTKRN